MNRTLLGGSLGLLFLGAAAARAQQPAAAADLRQVVEKQSQQIEELLKRVRQLEGQVTAPAPVSTQKGLMETNEALAQTNKRVEAVEKKLVLGKNIEGVSLTGDLRARYEMRDQDYDNRVKNFEDRSRLRSRFRLGVLWTNPTEEWEAGAGLASGGSDGRSTNQTWSEGSIFETGDIRLDYAYAKHKWLLGETPLSLTVGQQRSPWITTAINWDDDQDPLGITLQYGDPKGKEYAGPFVTLGLYDVMWGANLKKRNEQQDVLMYAGQAGYILRTEPVDMTFALGYRHVTSQFQDVKKSAKYAMLTTDVDGDGQYDAADGDKIKVVNDYDPYKYSPGLYNMTEEAGFEVVDGYIDAKTTVAGIELRPYGHYCWNIGAGGDVSQQNLPAGETPGDHDKAFMLGLDVTKAKWKLGYAYAYVESDAVFGPMKDSDLGETAGLMDTDVKGHVVKLSYNFTKNVSLGWSTMLLDRIEGGSATADEADSTVLHQFDAIYKF